MNRERSKDRNADATCGRSRGCSRAWSGRATAARGASQLDPLEPVLRRLLAERPQIKAPPLTEVLRSDYGYTGSLRLVQARLRQVRPSPVRAAQRTGYRPGPGLQIGRA